MTGVDYNTHYATYFQMFQQEEEGRGSWDGGE